METEHRILVAYGFTKSLSCIFDSPFNIFSPFNGMEKAVNERPGSLGELLGSVPVGRHIQDVN
jgi:hypothetical protein